jgi:hypothetical protein
MMTRIELIGNEGAESEQRQRVSDQLFPQQAGDEDNLDETVAEKVNCLEGLGCPGQMLRRDAEVGRHEGSGPRRGSGGILR